MLRERQVDAINVLRCDGAEPGASDHLLLLSRDANQSRRSIDAVSLSRMHDLTILNKNAVRAVLVAHVETHLRGVEELLELGIERAHDVGGGAWSGGQQVRRVEQAVPPPRELVLLLLGAAPPMDIAHGRSKVLQQRDIL